MREAGAASSLALDKDLAKDLSPRALSRSILAPEGSSILIIILLLLLFLAGAGGLFLELCMSAGEIIRGSSF